MSDTKKEQDVLERVASIVLAGGQGTRLFPLTESRCKPSVAFGGRYRLIDIPFSNALNSQIRRIFVISQYFSSELHHHILNTYHLDLFSPGGIELLTPEETPAKKAWFKGTADAVRQNLDRLLKAPVDYFLILSGDQLYNINFKEMLEFAIQKDADLVIATLRINEKEAKRMGVLKVDDQDKIIDFVEKPKNPATMPHLHFEKEGQFLGSMGIYIFKREALISCLQEEGDDFGHHVIPSIIKNKAKAYSYLYSGYWEDIGTIASYYQANLALLDSCAHLNTYDERNPIYTCAYNLPSPMIKDTLIKNTMISQGSIIEAKEISNSIIGIRAHIKKGTVIRNSLVLGNHFYKPPLHQDLLLPKEFTIGENCTIEKAIIDEHTYIGNNVQLINKDNLQKYDGHGVYIRDGVIIVTTGTRIPDGFSL
ncbi:MAG: sugar phosphate nucleotidyltransferase [Chlamydiota bacterium]